MFVSSSARDFPIFSLLVKTASLRTSDRTSPVATAPLTFRTSKLDAGCRNTGNRAETHLYIYLQIIQHKAIKYYSCPLSPLSSHRLSIVKRKVLVLDLDETLIHSHHDGVVRPTVKPGTPPDFILKVTIDRTPVRFFVHKRPHVDFFLQMVGLFPSSS